jgi:hydroxyethylthiazole kinase
MPAEGSEMSETCSTDLVREAAAVWDAARAARPRVHCITNNVAQAFTANLLLAAGMIPSMTHAADEAADFAARADALLINLGTLDPERRAAIPRAWEAARAGGRPVVLDPVFVERSPGRLAFARACLARRPDAVRLNAAEFEALAGGPAGPGAVADCARERGLCLALTGARDTITDGARGLSIDNGDDVMARVTAMGCAASALVAGCIAVARDPVPGAAAGLLAFAVAGEVAGARSRGPGSFPAHFLDELALLTGARIVALARCDA